MNIEPRAEICDSNRPALTNSAISQATIECQLNEQNNGMVDADELTKKVLKLDLTKRSDTEKGSFDSDEKADLDEIKSPKSPLTNLSELLNLIFIFFWANYQYIKMIKYDNGL